VNEEVVFGGVAGEENWGVEGIEIGGYMYSITLATKERKTHSFLSFRYRTYVPTLNRARLSNSREGFWGDHDWCEYVGVWDLGGCYIVRYSALDIFQVLLFEAVGFCSRCLRLFVDITVEKS